MPFSNTPEQPVETETPAESAPKPEDTLKYWQDKYNGLQGHAATMKKERDQLLAEKHDLSQKLEGINLEYSTVKTDLEGKYTQAQKLLQEKEVLATKLQNDLAVSTLIVTEFPALGTLAAKGLLRTEGLQGDELKQYLANLHTELTANQQNAVNRTLQGALPPSPAPAQNTTMTIQDYQKALAVAMRQHGVNSKEYMGLMAQYTQAMQSGQLKP